MTAVRERLAGLVEVATDGEITATDVLAEGGSLTAIGVTSLAMLRLIDALEEEFGVLIDLDGSFRQLDDFDALADRLAAPDGGGGRG
ncbi:phosphopantetheine-binding protein [Streptomyces sp. NPDC048462]|uniref:phosphopantetheine-binding protein n=1 Tax=Streptomyces sp. NPDC048462 TaxID=3365555 RepID=UPI003721C45A